jgi:hypothetical protein
MVPFAIRVWVREPIEQMAAVTPSAVRDVAKR